MKQLKILLGALNKVKYYIILFIVSFVVFFIMYFPGQRAASFVIESIAKQTGMAITSIGEDMSFIPAIGVSVESAKIRTSPMNPEINIGKSFFGIPVISLLIFSPSLEINASAFGGDINADIYGIPLSSSKKVEEMLVDFEAKQVKLSEILKLWAPLIDIEAKTDIKIEGALNMVSTNYSELNITADLSNVRFKESNIFGITIPDAVVKSGKLQAAVSNGELTIEKFVLGGVNQPVDISIRGKMSLKGNNPYDFALSIKLSGDMDKNLGNFLMLLPPQTKKSDGTYTFRLRGDTKAPIPQVIPM